MIKQELEKIIEFLNRTKDLPDEIIQDEDFKSLTIDDQDKKKAEELKYFKKRTEIYNTLNDLLLELRAFIKLKFGKESEYWRAFSKIGFDSEAYGLVINTFNSTHNKFWSEGKNQLYSLLKNIEAELKINIDTKSNHLEKFKDREKRRITILANVIFFLLVFLIPIFVINYLFSTLINWNSLKISDPLSWFNSYRFSKLEPLIIVFELVLVVFFIFIWKKLNLELLK